MASKFQEIIESTTISYKNMGTITISKQEYEHLKKLEQVDHDLIQQLVESLGDAKHGRIRRVV